uniref:Uncharacterized protein n=1 Tax=Opuntia streptacantha TaxID=393608 RepID=A0A7C9EBD7_OPUST
MDSKQFFLVSQGDADGRKSELLLISDRITLLAFLQLFCWHSSCALRERQRRQQRGRMNQPSLWRLCHEADVRGFWSYYIESSTRALFDASWTTVFMSLLSS